MKYATFVALLVAISMGPQIEAGECEKANYEKVSLQGTVVRQEKEFLDKTGEIKRADAYRLVTSDGDITLPEHRHCNGELKVDLQPFDGQKVTIVARGIQKPSDEGNTLAYVHEVMSVREVAEYEPISLQGKLVRQTRQELDKAGEIKTVDLYQLEASSAKIELPTRGNSDGDVQIDLQSFVGQNVTVAVRGLQKPNKDGKTLVYVHEVVSVREVESPNSANPFVSSDI